MSETGDEADVLTAPLWLKVLLLGLVTATLWLVMVGPASERPGKSGPRGELPAFKLATLDDGFVIPEDLKGRVTVLNFFATWCGPCKAEMPELVRYSEEQKGNGVVVIGVNAGYEEVDEVKPFAARYHVPYRLAVGGEELMFALGGKALPTTAIIDDDGHVARVYEGPVTASMLAEAVTYARGVP